MRSTTDNTTINIYSIQALLTLHFQSKGRGKGDINVIAVVHQTHFAHMEAAIGVAMGVDFTLLTQVDVCDGVVVDEIIGDCSVVVIVFF